MPGYDYSQPGSYFITVCTRDREECLARIEGEVSLPSFEGEAVIRVWESLPRRFPSVLLDEFVVMPNHIHGILHFTENDAELGEVVRTLKAASTHVIRETRPTFGWQRDYFDRVVRSEYEFDRIRAYIISNPATWRRDPDNLQVPQAKRDARDAWDVRDKSRGYTQ